MRIFIGCAQALAWAFLCLLVVGVSHAQVSSTRVTTYDWQCQDAAGVKISDHQREGSAIVACVNASNGAYVQGGRYRINKSAPAPTPTPAPALGSASLNWTPPTQNTNGTALTNLAGYRISYGTSATALTQVVQVANPSAVSYTVTGLAPGSYYFAVRAYTSGGTESALSNVASKTVQ